MPGRLQLTLMLAGLRLVLFCLVLFFGYNVWRLFAEEHTFWEFLWLLILILCQLFVTLHGLSYFSTVVRVVKAQMAASPNSAANLSYETPTLPNYPPVVIAVCAYKEPIEVVRDTLLCFRNLTYPEKYLFLLDDTRYDRGDPEEMAAYRREVEQICEEAGVNLFRRQWHGAKAGMINDFLDFLCGRPRPEFCYTNYQGIPMPAVCKYLAVFDADMNPLADFVEPIVARLEAEPDLAFVQTPQYYSNVFTNRMALGSAMQQVVFYEYICDGKSLRRLMPCCGTNVVFRIEALDSVGGMDDSSITEDFATSLNMHIKGWRSIYLNHVCAFGMGPNDLAGYFKQQFRWALGSVGLLRVVLRKWLAHPRALPMAGWLDYLSSVSYYCVGWIWLCMWLAPVVFLIFGFPEVQANIPFFVAMFIPYFLITTFLFFYSLSIRRYRIRDIFLSVALNSLCFPIFMKASLLALMGVKGSFGITPKAGATALPLHAIWPQVSVIFISVFAIAWGTMDYLHGQISFSSLIANAFWCVYNLTLVAMIFYFNHPERKHRLDKTAPAPSAVAVPG